MKDIDASQHGENAYTGTLKKVDFGADPLPAKKAPKKGPEAVAVPEAAAPADEVAAKEPV